MKTQTSTWCCTSTQWWSCHTSPHTPTSSVRHRLHLSGELCVSRTSCVWSVSPQHKTSTTPCRTWTSKLMLFNLILNTNLTFWSPASPSKLVMHVKNDLTCRTGQAQNFNSNYMKAYLQVQLQLQPHNPYFKCLTSTLTTQTRTYEHQLHFTSPVQSNSSRHCR